MLKGLTPSYKDTENGMTLSDMRATLTVARQLNEVIAFRSTGPWAKRWIEKGYPTKNFHVKGKSSNWGPHAGLVSYLGEYSKVGSDAGKASDGTKANDKGLASGFAGKQALVLGEDLILTQLTRTEESPRRTAIKSQFILDDGDRILFADRPGDNKTFAFLARKQGQTGRFAILVYPASLGINPFKLAGRKSLAVPLEVMTSGEVGGDMPMTGDYDLLAVCPSWADYGSRLSRDIVKPGINLRQGGLQQGQAFRAGVGMDNVLDPRLHTQGSRDWHSYQFRKAMYQKNARLGKTGNLSEASKKLMFGAEDYSKEHGDMGNLTPRILRCINALNAAMGATGDKGATRRIHHNAEALRPFLFGAIFGKEMQEKNEGFPFTIFHPAGLEKAAPQYGDVCTLHNMQEFGRWASDVKACGYYVPKNWAWGQSENPKEKFKRLFGHGPQFLPERH